MGKSDETDAAHRNEVLLVGRVSGDVTTLELPSGDVLARWRLVVDRRDSAPGRATIDTLDCATTRPGVRRTVDAWAPGDVVEVTGAIRRRFWRAPAGATSRVEVEVSRGRRLRRAPPASPPDRKVAAAGRSAASA